MSPPNGGLISSKFAWAGLAMPLTSTASASADGSGSVCTDIRICIGVRVEITLAGAETAAADISPSCAGPLAGETLTGSDYATFVATRKFAAAHSKLTV